MRVRNVAGPIEGAKRTSCTWARAVGRAGRRTDHTGGAVDAEPPPDTSLAPVGSPGWDRAGDVPRAGSARLDAREVVTVRRDPGPMSRIDAGDDFYAVEP